MNPSWTLRTGRLRLQPVGWADLADLVALKGDPLVYAVMLGGLRTPGRVADELAEDLAFWGGHGVGMWTVRHLAGGPLLGLTGLHERPDGLGIALRFAFRPEARGRGLGREAASAALRFAHDVAGLQRVVAVARESNFASRLVLGGIGMVECGSVTRDGHPLLIFESRRQLPPPPPP
jgi:RimJ/RimL family protein N-acetyltransferase